MKVTTFGGGKSSYRILKALKEIDGIDISAIVSMSDDGQSTGRLRDDYGVLPFGDIRRALLALADESQSEIFGKLFNYRFKGGGLHDHNLGNLIMIALEDILGSYGKSVNLLEDLFSIKGKVYPVTFEKIRLLARLENGEYILGEKNIDVPKHDGNMKIEHLFIVKDERSCDLESLFSSFDLDKHHILNELHQDHIPENNSLPKLISSSDYLMFAPGDLFSSILPTILVGDVRSHILNTKAKKILFVNLFTKYGETTGFNLSDTLNVFKKYFGQDIFDFIVVHDRDNYPLDENYFKTCLSEKKEPIKLDLNDPRIIKADLMDLDEYGKHDLEKLRDSIRKIIND